MELMRAFFAGAIFIGLFFGAVLMLIGLAIHFPWVLIALMFVWLAITIGRDLVA